MKEAHEKLYVAWKDQNETQLKINFIKRKKAVLERAKEQEDYKAGIKAEDDRVKAEIEEYEKMYGKPKKYQVQIDLCGNLITYLNSFSTKATEVTQEVIGFNLDCVESKLASGDWKKEKVHVLKKTEDWNEGVQPGQKKHKNKKSKSKKPTEEPRLTLTIETLGYFEDIKCSPPTYEKDIQGVIANLEEKKAYFARISDDLNEGKEVKAEEKEEVKEGEGEEKEDEKKEEKKKVTKKEKVNLDDDSMFPAMG